MRLCSDCWVFGEVGKQHDRDGFDCGFKSLNDFIKLYARQNTSKGINRTHILCRVEEPAAIIGYFTLALKPVNDGRHDIPAILIGRFAVDERYAGRGIGGYLLLKALYLIEEVSQILGVALVHVDALDERAARFYERFGFKRRREQGLNLYMSMKALRASLTSPPDCPECARFAKLLGPDPQMPQSLSS